MRRSDVSGLHPHMDSAGCLGKSFQRSLWQNLTISEVPV